MPAPRESPAATAWTEAALAAQPVVMRAEGLRKAFGGQVVLDGAGFEMRRGEVVLLRGPNGSGKTTLLNILTGNLEPDAGRIQILVEGAREGFAFPRSPLAALNPFDRFSPEGIAQDGLSRTWQDIRLFPSHSLQDNVVLAIKKQLGERPLAVLFRPGAVRREQRRLAAEAVSLLGRFGLAERAASSGDMVSLGQAKRVAIARTVQAGAKILFLDEPLAALDAAGIRDVIAFLRDIVREHQTTLVIVEHVFNIPRILDLATTVWTIAGGRLAVESPEAVRREAIDDPGDALRPWLAELAGGESRILDQPLPGGALLSQVQLDPAAGDAPLLEVDGLVVSRGRRAVIGGGEGSAAAGLGFRIRRGSVALLQAPNGWGKTTLLEALTGVLPVTRGSIRLGGRPIERLPVWDRVAAGLAIMQSRDNAFPNLSVEESLRLAGLAEAPAMIRPLLGRRMSALSGGERQKVVAACALARAGDRMALLDEPFAMLDARAIAAVQERLLQNRGGATLILIPAASQG
ncbi:MAG: ATP-binding cassette domain-containing protein [Dongiaceae bacterium]